MKWYDDLYVGESIVHKTNKIKWKIRHNAGQIIPSHELLQKGYPKKQLYVIGLAKGYDEAVEVAASVIDEVYRQTGAFEVASYLREKRRRKAE